MLAILVNDRLLITLFWKELRQQIKQNQDHLIDGLNFVNNAIYLALVRKADVNTFEFVAYLIQTFFGDDKNNIDAKECLDAIDKLADTCQLDMTLARFFQSREGLIFQKTLFEYDPIRASRYWISPNIHRLPHIPKEVTPTESVVVKLIRILKDPKGHTQAEVEALLAANEANFKATGPDDWTAMHCFACVGQQRLLQFVLDQLPASFVNRRTKTDLTALVLATDENYAEMVFYLIEQGARFGDGDTDQNARTKIISRVFQSRNMMLIQDFIRVFSGIGDDDFSDYDFDTESDRVLFNQACQENCHRVALFILRQPSFILSWKEFCSVALLAKNIAAVSDLEALKARVRPKVCLEAFCKVDSKHVKYFRESLQSFLQHANLETDQVWKIYSNYIFGKSSLEKFLFRLVEIDVAEINRALSCFISNPETLRCAFAELKKLPPETRSQIPDQTQLLEQATSNYEMQSAEVLLRDGIYLASKAKRALLASINNSDTSQLEKALKNQGLSDADKLLGIKLVMLQGKAKLFATCWEAFLKDYVKNATTEREVVSGYIASIFLAAISSNNFALANSLIQKFKTDGEMLSECSEVFLCQRLSSQVMQHRIEYLKSEFGAQLMVLLEAHNPVQLYKIWRPSRSKMPARLTPQTADAVLYKVSSFSQRVAYAISVVKLTEYYKFLSFIKKADISQLTAVDTFTQRTVLHDLASIGFYKVIELIAERVALVNIINHAISIDNENYTAFDLAFVNGNLSVCLLLHKLGAGFTARTPLETFINVIFVMKDPDYIAGLINQSQNNVDVLSKTLLKFSNQEYREIADKVYAQLTLTEQHWTQVFAQQIIDSENYKNLRSLLAHYLRKAKPKNAEQLKLLIDKKQTTVVESTTESPLSLPPQQPVKPEPPITAEEVRAAVMANNLAIVEKAKTQGFAFTLDLLDLAFEHDDEKIFNCLYPAVKKQLHAIAEPTCKQILYRALRAESTIGFMRVRADLKMYFKTYTDDVALFKAIFASGNKNLIKEFKRVWDEKRKLFKPFEVQQQDLLPPEKATTKFFQQPSATPTIAIVNTPASTLITTLVASVSQIVVYLVNNPRENLVALLDEIKKCLTAAQHALKELISIKPHDDYLVQSGKDCFNMIAIVDLQKQAIEKSPSLNSHFVDKRACLQYLNLEELQNKAQESLDKLSKAYQEKGYHFLAFLHATFAATYYLQASDYVGADRALGMMRSNLQAQATFDSDFKNAMVLTDIGLANLQIYIQARSQRPVPH